MSTATNDRPRVVVFQDSVYDLRDNGNVYRFLGFGKGWKMIHRKYDCLQLSVGNLVYEYLQGRKIYIYDETKDRTIWSLIDKNPDTSGIAASANTIYKIHRDGLIFKYHNKSWDILDQNKDTVAIVVDTDDSLYQLHGDGSIYKYLGSQEWKVIDHNSDTKSITAGGGRLYQIHKDGAIYRYNPESTPSWDRIDGKGNTVEIAAGEAGVFQRHGDGSVWRYTGSDKNWDRILDANDQIINIAVANHAYARKKDNSIIQFNGGGWDVLN